MGNIPPQLQDAQLHQIVASVVDILKAHIVKDAEGNQKNYGFVECRTMQDATNVISVLNELPLGVGGQMLVASIAKSSQPQPPPQQAAFPPQYDYGAVPPMGGNMGNMGGMGGGMGGMGMMPPPRQPQQMMPMPPAPQQPSYGSRCVVLDNMVDPSSPELVVQADYDSLKADIGDEVAKYGRLLDLIIPRPPQPGTGRVFLVYSVPEEAQRAIGALSNRRFGGAMVSARPYDERALVSGMYTA